MGRLTKDPEFKQITDNFCKLNFTLAITRKYRKDNIKSETDFIPVSMLGNNAMIGHNLLVKGSPILIWGSIQVRNYEKENERKWITEVLAENFQLLEKKKKQVPLDQSNSSIKEELISVEL
tara:strand:- start:68 stop:430 length:363 start_codon:yes stop_codon:yes gene_type:complete